MSIGDRVLELRKTLGLTQTDFGKEIMLSQTTVGQLESNGRNVTDRTIVLLCSRFNASEQWLRTGEGPMFEDNTDEMESIAKQLNLNAFQTRLLRLIHDLTPEQQILVQQMAHQLAGDEPPEESDRDRTARIARAALADYDRQQEEEVQDKRA